MAKKMEYIRRDVAIRYAQWEGAYKVVMYLEEMTAENVKRVDYGKWQQDGKTHKRCTNCKQFLVPNLKSTLFKYCPNCGADMRGSSDEN